MLIATAGQKRIHTLPGYGLDIREANADSVAWWLSDGIDPLNVAGAWTPKGKANQAASYLRDAGSDGYANIDPAIVGGVAPGWDGVNGWKPGAGAYLKTGIIPSGNTWSAIIKISNRTSVGTVELGSFTAPAKRSLEIVAALNAGQCAFGHGSTATPTAAPNVAAGTLAIAGGNAYVNGSFATAIVQDTVQSGVELYIHALNFSGGAAFFSDAYIQAIAVYNVTITAPQVAAVHAAMP